MNNQPSNFTFLAAHDQQLVRLATLAAEAARATALLDRLDQATLAKAFRGELLANGTATYQA